MHRRHNPVTVAAVNVETRMYVHTIWGFSVVTANSNCHSDATPAERMGYNALMKTLNLKPLALKTIACIAALAMALLFACGCSPEYEDEYDEQESALQTEGEQDDAATQEDAESQSDDLTVTEDGSYTTKEEVALYIHTYGHLPSNFISKTKARNAGWVPSEGNLDEVCPGKSIGGSRFYNDEGLLPDAKGRTWTECDINYHGGTRGGERIVFSNDGLVYYTGNHYNSFERLY